MVTAARLREVLIYDPLTGVFTWRVTCNARAAAGSVAGCPGGENRTGRIRIRVDGTLYLAHRLAFLYMTGSIPSGGIDHEDRDHQNNRWLNLRPATGSQNNANASLQKNNSSGVKGVRWVQRLRKYHARIAWHGREIHLGYFSTMESAVEFRRLAAELLFGEFANPRDFQVPQ